MFVLSNKKILALVAMAACMATLANAEGTRARAKRRVLKASKNSKSGGTIAAQFTNFLEVTRPEVNINLVTNSFSYTRFDRQCPTLAADIVSCSGNSIFCKMCVVGQANLNENGSWQGMKDQCLKIGRGHCEGCRDDQILDYYNCGTGRNMTVAGNMTVTGNMTDTPANPVSPVNPGLPSVGDVTVQIQSGNIKPGAHPNNMGGPPCPWDKPVSGGACDTLGYEYATCLYAGVNNVCSCWWNQPLWSCVDDP